MAITICWDRYPATQASLHASTWFTIQVNLGLADNTIGAYLRALEDYLRFCSVHQISPDTASKSSIAAYVRDLLDRPRSVRRPHTAIDLQVGLANATIQQRITVIRLYYDYLIEESIRDTNPVERRRYTSGNVFGHKQTRSLVPRYHTLPWIPTEEQWQAILEATAHEPIRNRLMFALAYDAALRREEVCSLETADIDPTHRTLRIRAEVTKNRQERIVPYSKESSALYQGYLAHRRTMSRAKGSLFLSESHRNYAYPLSIWTWSKVIANIGLRAGVAGFSTHTLRHLCLTDLARAGWQLHEIATFAGHRSLQTTMLYIHLSSRELSDKLNHGMAQIHAWRTRMLAEALQ